MRQELGTERKGTLLFTINFVVLFKFHFLLLLRACITFFFIYYFYNLKLFTFCLFGPWLSTDDVVTSHGYCNPYSYFCFQCPHFANCLVCLNGPASLEGWG